VKDKDIQQPTDIDATRDDATTADSPNERIYDLDAASVEPIETGDPDGDRVEAKPDEASEKDPDDTRGRNPLKFSRRDVLDRFQEKNTVIARLTKEKHSLEKQLASLPAEKAALESQAKESKDRWLRTAAEFENYRKRSAKEWELLKQQSKAEIILEVLSSLDDFERAFAAVEATDESEFVRGIRLIYNNLLQVLQKLGVEETDALGAPFDPNRHMAIGQIETDEVASGHVAQVAQKGYALNGSVIRPARVIVAK
jgi:molecular chaperone GrpE